MAELDVHVDGGGTVYLVTPISQLANEWVDAHVNLEGWQWLGSSFSVEHRFIAKQDWWQNGCLEGRPRAWR